MRLHLYKRHNYWLIDHMYANGGAIWRRNTFPTFDQARIAVAVQLSEWKTYERLYVAE